MPADHPNHQPMPRWAIFAGLALGAVVILGGAFWLLTGGMQTIKRMLPQSVASAVFDEPSDVKVVMPKADPNGAPWRQKAYERESAGDDKAGGRESDDEAPNQAEQVSLSLDQAAQAADDAIATVRTKPDDQRAVAAADKAIEALRLVTIPKGEASVMQAAKERRTELVTDKRAALDEAKRLGRVTHELDAAASLRSAAADASAEQAALTKGTQVHRFLDTGTGWARIEVLSGDHAGKNGYVHSSALHKAGRK